MKKKSLSSILFSGRYDKPHLSHFLTIKELSKKYDRVVVVMLDYKESFYPISMRKYIMECAFEDYDNVEVKINKTHFAKITKEEFKSFNCDIYGAGNLEVLKHMEAIGIPCVYVPRSLDNAASNDVNYQKIMEILKDGKDG